MLVRYGGLFWTETQPRGITMPKELLNEAERFLLKHWTDSRSLEESMEGVRTKVQTIISADC